MMLATDDLLVLPMAESTQVGEARRLSAAMARRNGFDETGAGKVAIVVTELSSNLVRHASRGELLVRSLNGAAGGIEILAVDHGPGMSDLALSMRDDTSTAGAAGTGLGAVTRLADTFAAHSTIPAGTVLLARVWAQSPRTSAFEVGAVSVPKPREDVCGDSWWAEELNGICTVAVVDGLGHGPMAFDASRRAIEVVRLNPGWPPGRLVGAAHEALRGSRGAAIGVARVAPGEGTLTFAGVGNIEGAVVWPGGNKRLVSHNGTLGHEISHIQEFIDRWPGDASLVLHSDGLGTHWTLDRYPGLLTKDPSVVAGVLYRDFDRGYDDTTVVVVCQGRGATR